MSNPDQVQLISVTEITVLNPRVRNKQLFADLVKSIANLGLKKPITVSPRTDGSGYLLVCGQGRLEAFVSLGQHEIPALVIQASAHDAYVMSLVENIARRQHTPIELVHEIGALRQRGYTVAEIAAKTDFSVEYISALSYLLDHGEDRLLNAMERGLIPATIAVEISKAHDGDVQRALTEAYESKSIPGNQVLVIRKIIEQRNAFGKGLQRTGGQVPSKGVKVTADVLIRAYRKETDRQQLLVRKAAVAQQRLIFVVNALRRLLADEHFVTLLRAEAMHTLPRILSDRVGGK